MKEGAKTCWSSFTVFVDKFCELIFICTMLGASLYIWINIVLKDEATTKHTFANVIISLYLIGLAGVIFLSMREHPKLLEYCGFLRGKLSKALFYLFCTSLVFPVGQGFMHIQSIAAYVLLVISVLQIIKVCKKDDDDTNDQDPMMNEVSPDNQNNSSIDYGYQP